MSWTIMVEGSHGTLIENPPIRSGRDGSAKKRGLKR